MGIRLTAAGYGRISHAVRREGEVCVGWQFPGLEGVRFARVRVSPGVVLVVWVCVWRRGNKGGWGSFFDALRRGGKREKSMYVCSYV